MPKSTSIVTEYLYQPYHIIDYGTGYFTVRGNGNYNVAVNIPYDDTINLIAALSEALVKRSMPQQEPTGPK